MAYEFPLHVTAFADLLRAESFRWELVHYVETSGTAIGERLTSEIAAPKWRATATLAPMLRTEAMDIQALFEVLGPYNTFHLYDLRKSSPAADPDGTIYGASAVTINSVGVTNIALRLEGMPAGYDVTRGDMMHVSYGTDPVRRALYRITESFNTPGSGITPWFEIRPPLKAGTAVGNGVDLRKPAARMVLEAFDAGTSEGRWTSGMSFSAIESR